MPSVVYRTLGGFDSPFLVPRAAGALLTVMAFAFLVIFEDGFMVVWDAVTNRTVHPSAPVVDSVQSLGILFSTEVLRHECHRFGSLALEPHVLLHYLSAVNIKKPSFELNSIAESGGNKHVRVGPIKYPTF